MALHRARASGLDVAVGFNLFDEESGRVAFHGTRRELVRRQCEALELEPLLVPVGKEGFEPAFLETLARLVASGVSGVVFGNVHLEDVRTWYEERTTASGLLHLEPLWGEEPIVVVSEVVGLGYRARVVSVDLELGDPSWLGRDLDDALVREILRSGADPCGEKGEYHTFVHDGPAFRRPVEARTGEVVEMKGHRLQDLLPA